MIRIVKTGDRRIEAFNARPAFPDAAEKAAAEVLADIRAHGDAAVRKYVAKFDGWRGRDLKCDLSACDGSDVPPFVRRAGRDAHRRVMKFSKASLRRDPSRDST